MARFTYSWDDFSGGYYMGGNAANQPANTFLGVDTHVDPNDGMLYPVWDYTTVSVSSGTPQGTVSAGGTFQHLFFDADQAVLFYYDITNSRQNAIRWTAPGAWASNNAGVTLANSNLAASSNGAMQPVIWTPDQIYMGYFPTAGVNNLALYTLSTNTWTLYPAPTTFVTAARWREFLVGASVNNRLYYSSPYAPTTFPAANFLDIGDSGIITALIPMDDALYVGKEDGWWVVSGIFNATTWVRRAAVGFPGPHYPSSGLVGAIATPMGIMYDSSTVEVAASVLSGDVVTPINRHQPAARSTLNRFRQIREGLYIFDGGDPGQFWMVDTRSGRPRWSKLAFPPVSNDYVGVMGQCLDFTSSVDGGGRDMFLITDGNFGLRKMSLSSLRSTANPSLSTPQRVTVQLSPRQKPDEFEVLQMYVEVATWDWVGTVDPYVEASIIVRGSPSAPEGRYQTTPVRAELDKDTSANYAGIEDSDTRKFQTFVFNGGAARGTEVAPIISLYGCKLRRVWVACRDAGQS